MIDGLQRDGQRVLNGRVAVITGANGGLGREIAAAMARAGARLALVARDRASLGPVEAEASALGADVISVACDVSDETECQAMGESVRGHYGRTDVVVANAGIAGPTAPMHEISLSDWRACLATDLDGVFLTFRPFIPSMIEARGGSLIAISSLTGKRPLFGRTPYAAAKMGIIGLVRTLALEVGPYGVRANAVCPGAIDGPRMSAVFEAQASRRGITPEEARREFVGATPLGDLVDARDVAEACVFLASDAAAAITGEDLNVSNGLVMY